MVKEPPNAWTSAQVLLYAFSLIGFFCSTMNGYDGSLINNLLQNQWFKEYYSVQSSGIWAGIVSSVSIRRWMAPYLARRLMSATLSWP
jgi:hypothetical protein